MNINNIQKAIAIMERAKARDSVHMSMWQTPLVDWKSEGDCVLALTEEELHTCGNKACFGGHIAVSPEFQADGGLVAWTGEPLINVSDSRQETAACAIAYWLGISVELAEHLACYPGNISPEEARSSNIYPVPFEDVKAEHVIVALNQLLELGEEECLKLWNNQKNDK